MHSICFNLPQFKMERGERNKAGEETEGRTDADANKTSSIADGTRGATRSSSTRLTTTAELGGGWHHQFTLPNIDESHIPTVPHTGSKDLCGTRLNQEHKIKFKEFSPIKCGAL